MTPEQEKKIDRLAMQVAHLHDAVNRTLEHVLEHDEWRRKAERRLSTVARWLRLLISERKDPPGSVRPPMPSLTADDSGSFEVSVLGSSAKFTGAVPVKFGLVLAIVALVGLAGWYLRSVTAHASTPPIAAERKGP